MEINNTYMVTENTRLDSLILGAAGKLEPPEGKLLTVVVNGVEVDPVPGAYTGDIRLIITVLHGLRYAREGLKALLDRRLNVAVLDAEKLGRGFMVFCSVKLTFINLIDILSVYSSHPGSVFRLFHSAFDLKRIYSAFYKFIQDIKRTHIGHA